MGDHEGKEKVRGRRGAHDLSRRAMEGRHVLAEILVDSPTEIGTLREASRAWSYETPTPSQVKSSQVA